MSTLSRLPFHLIQCSSQSEGHPANSLESCSPQSTGWICARFADYPQELILDLGSVQTIRQLQILSHECYIANRVELFVGVDSPSKSGNKCPRRLGYLSLDANKGSHYKARELKTVDIEAQARYINLRLHRNHNNAVNLYGQVGIVALNVLGSVSTHSHIEPGAMLLPSSDSMQDLSLDMALDPSTAAIVRQLDQLKIKAVQSEDYDEAKRLKQSITSLKSIGADLAQLESEKRRAVQAENYDLAAEIKMKQDQIRRRWLPDPNRPMSRVGQADSGRTTPVIDLPPRSYAVPAHVSPAISPISPSPGRSHNIPSRNGYNKSIPSVPYDDRPLPAQLHHNDSAANPFGDRPGSIHDHEAHVIQTMPNDGMRRNQSPLKDPNASSPNGGADIVEELPPLSESDRQQYHELIDVFGETTIQGLFSRKVLAHRSAALDEIEQRILSEAKSFSKESDDVNLYNIVWYTIQACHIACSDPIAQVCVRGMLLLETLIDKVFPIMEKDDIYSAMDQVTPTLLTILDSQSGKSRSQSRHCFDMLVFEYPKLAARYLIKPLRAPSAQPNALQARVELLTALITRVGMSEDFGLRLDHLVRHFVQPSLVHRRAACRQAGMSLAVTCHSFVGDSILSFLDGLNPKLEATLRSAFEHQQLQAQQRVLNTPTQRHDRPRVLVDNSSVQSRVALHPLPDEGTEEHEYVDDFLSGDDVVTTADVQEINDGDDDDSVCRFCGLRDLSFLEEENLDLHYWMHCPLLTSCSLCEQVVEIPTLADHLLNECEKSSEVIVCNQCRVPFASSDRHKSHPCPKKPAASERDNRCPLCCQDIGPGENGWRHHLLGPQGCSFNTRTTGDAAEVSLSPLQPTAFR